MKNHIMVALMLIVSLSGTACTSKKEANPVKTVDKVDLQRYLGTWYQQAFYPTRFQKADCGEVVTANYSLDEKGNIRVVNTCYEDAGATVVKSQADAKAWAVDDTNSKLKVQFFWPFRGNYWIVKLDQENYSYSVVSDPKREYLWILSRDMAIDEAVYQDILDWLESNGWDLNRLVFTGKLK